MAAFSSTVRKRIIRIAIGILFLAAILYLLGGVWYPQHPSSSAERQRVLSDAEPVVAAIQHYQKDIGHPPVALSTLVPKYLAQLPKPTAGITSGQNYLYTVEGSNWWLGISLHGERAGTLCYNSAGKYPAGKPEHPVERIGPWAYYHGDPY